MNNRTTFQMLTHGTRLTGPTLDIKLRAADTIEHTGPELRLADKLVIRLNDTLQLEVHRHDFKLGEEWSVHLRNTYTPGQGLPKSLFELNFVEQRLMKGVRVFLKGNDQHVIAHARYQSRLNATTSVRPERAGG